MKQPKKRVNRRLVFFILALLANMTLGGTQCPPYKDKQPCYCSTTISGAIIVTCLSVRNATELAVATASMKSMIADRLILLGIFHNKEKFDSNEVEDVGSRNDGERLPPRWLISTRLRVLEIQDSNLSNCFLCDDPLEGQEEFLVSLIVTHSSLNGQLCVTCTKGNGVTTKNLEHLKKLNTVDFSFNTLQIIAEKAFPSTLGQLSKIVLSNNQITKVSDNAFSNLNQLKELDLSHNRLSSVSKKIFRSSDTTLRSLDLSWNSIQVLPDDFFRNLRGLKEFKMNHNLFVTLSENTFSSLPLHLEKLDMKGNFLVCNCSLSWVKDLSKNTKISARCTNPDENEHHDVKQAMTLVQSCK